MKNPVTLRSEMPMWRQMELISRRYQAALSKRLSHLGIERYFFMMPVIDEGKGQFTQQDLSDILEIDKVLMVGIIDYLSEKGFVERKRNKDDGRKHRIVLAPKARAALPEIRKSISELNRLALSELPARHAGKFMEVLALIRTTLEKSHEKEKAPGKQPSRHSRK